MGSVSRKWMIKCFVPKQISQRVYKKALKGKYTN